MSVRMTISSAILAQHASAQLVGAPCGEQMELWNRQEVLHAAARDQGAALAAATPLLHLCEGCGWERLMQCREWASIDQYTGIAAGTAWVNGVSKPAHWVPQHPPKQRAG